MNKRIATDSVAIQMLSNTKHAKVGGEDLTTVLNDIQFMDFDDEFTTSEESIDEQHPSTSDSKNCFDNKLHGSRNTVQACDAIDAQQSNDNLLDLSTWKRCVIERCERDARTNDLLIYGHEDPIKCSSSNQTNKTMQCRLQHFWSQCRIAAGDIVSIIAIWDVKLQTYCVTSADGLVVVRPDFLVSGTTVVGGLFCMRKAVLQDRFKGIETGIKIVSNFTPKNFSAKVTRIFYRQFFFINPHR